MNFNIYNVIILLGIIHGIIFSIILLSNSKFKSKTNNFLSFTVLSLCLSNLQYWFLDTGVTLRSDYDDNSLIFIPFEFLILPFFYFFVKEYINKPVKKIQTVLLFLPFVLSIVYISIRNEFSNSIEIIKRLNLFVEYVSIFFTVLIIVLLFKTLLKHEKLHLKNKQSIPLKINWLKRILLLGVLLCVFWFISLNFLKNFYGNGYYKFYPLWIGISVLLYWIAYASIIQSNIYNERKEIRKLRNERVRKKNKQKLNKDKFNELHDLIKDNEFFLNPKLNLSFLSKKIGKSEGYISQLINLNYKKNFNDYINELRIEYVKSLLINEKYSHYTITAIGLEAGFNTKASFYSVFKKFTGKTPNEYKKLVQIL